MVVSLNRGTPIWTPKYDDPYYRHPRKRCLNFGGTSIYIYIYEPATFWVNAPLDFTYSHKSKGE